MKTLIKTSIIVLGIVAVISQGIVIYISNTSAADSIHATELTARLEEVREDNVNLQSKILVLASYQTISSRAAEMGLRSTKEFVSVYTPLPIALGR